MSLVTENVEQLSWDRIRTTRSFVTDMPPEHVLTEMSAYYELTGWEAEAVGPLAYKASKWFSMSVHLEPFNESARQRMAAWVLRDMYPRNVGRGCYLEAYYRYTFDVSVEPGSDRDGNPFTSVTTIYEEEIDPFGGGIPDKADFWVRSEFDTHDPHADVMKVLGARGG